MPSKRSELQKVRDMFANVEPEKALIWLEVIEADLTLRGFLSKKKPRATKKPKPVLQQAAGSQLVCNVH